MANPQPVNNSSGNNSSAVTIDLRGNGSIRKSKNYKLSDIVYTSSEYSASKAADVIPLILLEKQPKYPTYADSIGDTAYSAYEWIRNKIANTKLGTAGANVAEYGLQVAGKASTNNIVSKLSKAANASSYWSNPSTYGYHMFGLFNIEGGGPIMTYELPFYSDYFLTTDGNSGWKTGGAEMYYGRNLSQLAARFANIGYPVTPDWEFNPHYETVEFTFHLLNDSSKSAIDNTIWLYSLAAGTMYVQIENEKIDLSASDDNGAAIEAYTMVAEYLKSVSSFFKSPNVYEAIVPGRFRWLWCSMEVDIKCVGKFIRDGFTEADGATKSMSGQIPAFPEAYKVTVRLRSLLPQSFNQFNYFLSTKYSDKALVTEPFTPPDLVGNMEKLMSKMAGADATSVGDLLGLSHKVTP